MKKKRRYRQVMAFLLAAVLILSTGTGSPVFAEAEETEAVTGQEQVTEPVTEPERPEETETVTGGETTGESELITEPVTEMESETQNMPPAQVQSAPPAQNQILEDSAKTDEAVQSVQELIDALPTAEELKAMSLEEQQVVYEQVQAAYDAYNALTTDQQEQITGAEVINDLFDVFNGMVALAADNFSYSDTKDSNDSITRTYTGGSGDSITISASDPATFNINAVVFNIDGSLTVTNSVSIPSWNVSPVTVSAGNLLIGGDFTAVTRILIEDGYVEADNISVSTNVSSGNLGIIINGGIVKANSISVHNENGSAGGSQNLTINGDAVVFVEEAMTNTAGANTNKGVDYTKGVVFTGNIGEVYDSVTLPGNITIPEGYTLNINSGTSLTVPNGVTIYNYGTININGGTLTNNGTINNYGTISGNVGGNTPMSSATVSVTVPGSATYGESISLAATVKDSSGANINSGSVSFYQGTADNGTLLGTVEVSNGTATLSNVALNSTNWIPSNSPYTITAVYSGGTGLLSGSDDATLTVSKGTQDTPPAAPNVATATTNSVTLTAVSGSNIEYGYTTGTGGQPGNWQTETTFNNLSAGTDYTFYTRYAETDYYEASDPSTTGLTVTTLPDITTTSLPTGYVGVPYHAQLQATVANGKEITWSLGPGATLPAGLQLNSDGTITGTPTATVIGKNVEIMATISGGQIDTWNKVVFCITINAGTPDITVTTYNGVEQTDIFNYGDTITVSGTIAASATAPGTSTNAITQNQVGLYLDETELATADVSNDGRFTLTYDTSNKGITPSESAQTLTVKYGGSSDLNSGSTTVTVTLNRASITGEVTISGNPIRGEVLTASYTPGSGEKVVYQWTRDGSEIAGANSNTYTLAMEDVGHKIAVIVTATDENHTGSVVSDPVIVRNPSSTIYYALHFDTNGGNKMSSVVREAGTVIDLSEYIPVREGYTFTSWYRDAELTRPVTEVTLDNTKTIYAGWKEIETDTRQQQEISMTNPLQERDLKNGSRNTMSKVCTLKLGFGVDDPDLSLSYETSDPSVATVENGKITYQGIGTCIITVTAAETDLCKAASLEIPVKVGSLGTPTFTPSVTSRTAQKAFVVTSSTVRGVDGWEVQYSIRDDFWRATTRDFPDTGAKLYRETCTTVHSNMTYYIHVRGYQIIDGEKVYSDWSPVKTVRTK